MTRTAVGSIVVAALSVVGCSSSEPATVTTPASTIPPATSEPPTTEAPPDTSPPTTEAPPETAPPTTTGDASGPDGQRAIDQALARQALLTIDDFPEGWTEEEASDDPDDDPDPDVQAQFDECIGGGAGSVADQLEGRDVSSPEFSSPDGGASVEQEVLLADDETMAIAAMEEVGTEGADECIQAVIQPYFETEFANDPDAFPPGTTLGAITVGRVPSTVDPTVAVEYQLVVPFELDGDVLELYFEVVYLRQGRALSQVQFLSIGAPFDPEGIGVLGGLVLDRLLVVGS